MNLKPMLIENILVITDWKNGGLNINWFVNPTPYRSHMSVVFSIGEKLYDYYEKELKE